MRQPDSWIQKKNTMLNQLKQEIFYHFNSHRKAIESALRNLDKQMDAFQTSAIPFN